MRKMQTRVAFILIWKSKQNLNKISQIKAAHMCILEYIKITVPKHGKLEKNIIDIKDNNWTKILVTHWGVFSLADS